MGIGLKFYRMFMFKFLSFIRDIKESMWTFGKLTLQIFPLLHTNFKDCAACVCLLPTVCQLNRENKVHSWHISITPWALRTCEDTSERILLVSPPVSLQSSKAAVLWWTAFLTIPVTDAHRLTVRHEGGSCISFCRYVDAWETAATGWSDKTAHFILGTSDSAASSTESGSAGPDWNWITQQQKGVGTRLSEQGQKTTGSGLRFQAESGSVEYDCVYMQRSCVPV